MLYINLHKLGKVIRSRKNRTNIDRAMMLAAFIHPAMALPQVIQVYQTRDVSGLSLFTWLSFGIFGLLFLAYGFVHRLWPYIIMQLCWITINTSIVAGIILYGIK